MTNKENLESIIGSIADAVRLKSNKQSDLSLVEMVDEIDNISSGGNASLEYTSTTSPNGAFSITVSLSNPINIDTSRVVIAIKSVRVGVASDYSCACLAIKNGTTDKNIKDSRTNFPFPSSFTLSTTGITLTMSNLRGLSYYVYIYVLAYSE